MTTTLNALLDKHPTLFTVPLEGGGTWRRFSYFGCHPGWSEIIGDMLDEMAALGAGESAIIEAISAAEGHLEVLVEGRISEEVVGVIERAEDRAEITCQGCGGERDLGRDQTDWFLGFCSCCLHRAKNDTQSFLAELRAGCGPVED